MLFDDVAEERNDVELRILLRTVAALLFVEVEIEALDLLRTQGDALIIQQVAERPVKVVAAFIGQNVADRAVDVEQ